MTIIKISIFQPKAYSSARSFIYCFRKITPVYARFETYYWQSCAPGVQLEEYYFWLSCTNIQIYIFDPCKTCTNVYCKLLNFLQQLVKNRTLLCTIVVLVADQFLLSSVTNFLPKILENVFAVSASFASILIGNKKTLSADSVIQLLKLLNYEFLRVELKVNSDRSPPLWLIGNGSDEFLEHFANFY